jgi:hypothetical protein
MRANKAGGKITGLGRGDDGARGLAEEAGTVRPEV